jgi:hypothetical protein
MPEERRSIAGSPQTWLLVLAHEAVLLLHLEVEDPAPLIVSSLDTPRPTRQP